MSESMDLAPASGSLVSTTNDANSEMWNQIIRMPSDLLAKTDKFEYIEKVMCLVSKYSFEVHDEHMIDPSCTVKLGKLLLTISSKSLAYIAHLREELTRISHEKADMRDFLESKIDRQNTELALPPINTRESNFSHSKDFLDSKGDAAKAKGYGLEAELNCSKKENAALSLELHKMKRAIEELRHSLQAQQEERASIKQENTNLRLEHTHLVSRYRRLVEKSARAEQILQEYRIRDTQESHKEDEFEKLRNEVKLLRQENYALIDSRDRAEELCERRESEALRDMSELQRLTKDLIDEERSKLREATEDYMVFKQEHEANLQKLISKHADELCAKDEEIAKLCQKHDSISVNEINNLWETFPLENFSSKGPGSFRGPSVEKAERQRLERENADFAAEVEELELRIDAMEEENKRLTKLIRDYENGNEGLLHLRHELTDHVRTVEILQDENSQLRERLNSVEDSASFTAALQALCKRVGVTDEEINRLRPQNITSYNEIDILRDELSVLKEEVEWLEKDRRHWMDKVRLQPLMDTKLRFDLGLSNAQLKRLDALIDQMKSGNLGEDDSDLSCKEKHRKEMETRHKGAQEFNEYVLAQIDAIKHVFSNSTDTVMLERALSSLQKSIDALTPAHSSDPEELSTIHLLKAELESAKRKISEFELTAKDNKNVIQTLHDKLAALKDEKEVVMKERDQYRGCVFAALDMPFDGVTETSAEDALDARVNNGLSPRRVKSALTHNAKWAAIASSLRDQIKRKDDFINVLNHKLEDIESKNDEIQKQIETEKQLNLSTLRIQEDLNNQIAVLQEMNEDMNEKNIELRKVNTEVTNAMNQLKDGGCKEIFQKVVLLRRREAKLLSRLRKAIAAQADAAAEKKRMQATMDTTFKNLQDALQGSSTGFVLPSSSALHNYEEKQLDLLHVSLESLLQGRLLREDSRYLLHLQQVYQNLEASEDVSALREKDRNSTKIISSLQDDIFQLKLQIEAQRSIDIGAQCQEAANDSCSNKEYNSAAVSRWESECTMWRQKYELCYKRLDVKMEEVSLLEKALDAARQEIVEVKDNVRNLLHAADHGLAVSLPSSQNEHGDGNLQGEKDATAITLQKGAEHPHETTAPALFTIQKLVRFERDMARLKSVNLGLLQHSLDLQSTIKSLEIELEQNKQEISLIRDASNTKVINDFVNAAVCEHAALRRQSERALIQVKRLKVQLAATEANYQVVANEATSYKLSAYRLYRRYIEEIVAIVDYIRCLQRACKGSLSPHRAEMMDKRFQLVLGELDSAYKRNKTLATELSDKLDAIKTLEQQNLLLRTEKEAERNDAIELQLLDARAAIRRCMCQLTESQEDHKFSQSKIQRMETYVKQLSEEIERMEFRCWGMAPLDEGTYEKLLHLRDTVFAKAEMPPLAVQPVGVFSLHSDNGEVGKSYLDEDEGDKATREYKAAILKQRELFRECAGLKEELEAKSREIQRLSANAQDLQENINRLEDKITMYQRQLENEQVKTKEREDRLRTAHEAQSEIVRKAAEHNCQCLRDMVQRKDDEIHHLQQLLHTERQRYAGHQLDEANRLERLYERMFCENEAMMERFKNAVQDKTGINNASQQLQLAALPGIDSPVSEQLHHLTSDNIRLQRELQDARVSIVALQSELNQQNQYLQGITQPTTTVGPSGAIPTSHEEGISIEGASQSHPPTQKHISSAIRSTDILTGIINTQGAMIESMRQRELALSSELQREKQLRIKSDATLQEVKAHQIEQDGALRLVTQLSTTATDSASVRELCSNVAYLEQELRNTKKALEDEKTLFRQLQLDAEDSKKNLESTRLELFHLQVEMERSGQLATLNEGLQSDLNAVKDQNDKLVTAVSLLKEKLMAEARKGSESARQYHQELALAQRMGSIQRESAEHIKMLDHRIKVIQQKLNERISKDEALARNGDTGRMYHELQQRLRHKEAELVKLKHQIHRLQTEKSHSTLEHHFLGKTQPKLLKGKEDQVLAVGTSTPTPCSDASAMMHPTPTVPELVGAPEPAAAGSFTAHTRPTDSGTMQPQGVSASITPETRRMERGNLDRTSELYSQLARTNKDLAGTREQLMGAQENNFRLRQKIRLLKKEMEEMVMRHACEVAQLRSLLPSNRPAPEQRTKTHSTADMQQPIENFEELMLATVEDNRELVESKSKQRDQQRRTDSQDATSSSAFNALGTSEHTRAFERHAKIIRELRRQLQVDAPARENILRRRIAELDATVDRLVGKVSCVEGSSPEEVRRIYSVPRTDQETSISTLQNELLEKSNTILDIRFAQESLKLQVDRLQRDLTDCMPTEGIKNTAHIPNESLQGRLLQTLRGQQNQMEAMLATIDNLKLLIEHLQSRNCELSLQTSRSVECDKALAEVRRLRNRVSVMQDNFLELSRSFSALAQPSTAFRIGRQPKLRQRLLAAQAEAEDYHTQLEALRKEMEIRLTPASARWGNIETSSQQRSFSTTICEKGVSSPCIPDGIELLGGGCGGPAPAAAAGGGRAGDGLPPPPPAPLVDTREGSLNSRRVEALVASHGGMRHHCELGKGAH